MDISKRFERLIGSVDVDDFYTALIDARIDQDVYDAVSAIADGKDFDSIRNSFKKGKKLFDSMMEDALTELEKQLEGLAVANQIRNAKVEKEEERIKAWRDDMNNRNISPEAPEGSPLGLFAFPNDRVNRLPPEPDTDVEKELYKKLDSHFNYGGGGISGGLSNGLYTSVYKRPQPAIVYRGMQVEKSWLEENVPGYDGSDDGEVNAVFKYNSRNNSSSWSYSEDVARRWAGKNGVVLVARTGDNIGNMLDGEQLYSQIPRFERYRSEMEVVGLDDIVCFAAKWSLRKT
jgi:hypothetical protein